MIARREILRVAAGLAIIGLSGCQTTSQAVGDAAPVPGRPLTVIYVGADDCPYCHDWEMFSERDFLASKDRQKVTYRRLMFQGYSNITSDAVWPADLRWVRDELGLRSGTPRFIVVRDREIVYSTFGRYGWKSNVLPLIREQAS